MTDIAVTEWTGRSHRAVHAELVSAGWSVCGTGDWAVTLRSPDGERAARVCPFDPAYPVYVDLCRSRPDDPYLPSVDAHVDLAGGAMLTVLPFLSAAPADVAERIRRDWDVGTDPALAALRAAAEEHSAAAARLPWWGGVDLNPGNVMVDADGRPRLVDVFFVDGRRLYAALLADPAAVARAIPADRRVHMAEIAAVIRDSTVADLAALRRAAAV